MNGRAQVSASRQKLDATFARIKSAQPEPELLSDFARYLCVLVSGFIENSVAELLLEHTRRNSKATVEKYVAWSLERLTNLNCEKISQQLGRFNSDWQTSFKQFATEEIKTAIDSVSATRNSIAHGDLVSITYHRISDYYMRIKPAIEHIANLCVPAAGPGDHPIPSV
jgi:RiboL-PSP-HEPN